MEKEHDKHDSKESKPPKVKKEVIKDLNIPKARGEHVKGGSVPIPDQR